MNFKTTLLLAAAIALAPVNPLLAHPHHSHNHSHDHVADGQSKDKVKIAYKTPSVPAKNEVKIYIKGGYRYIVSNAIPDHPTGQFPNSGNPNTIKAQKLTFKVPARPKVVHKSGLFKPMIFGVAVNGVPFDPATGETYDGNPMSKGWRYEALTGKINLGCDGNNAHVQPDGTYHYHGIPTALLKKRSGGKNGMVLLGFAADGFPFYGPVGFKDPKNPKKGVKRVKPSYRLRSGTRQSAPGGKYDGTFTQDFVYQDGLGDLDECNGRFGVTPEYPKGIYHYYLTYQFPFVPRRFKGNPDSSFKHRSLPPQRPAGTRPGMPGQTGQQARGGFPPPPHMQQGGRGGFPPPPPHMRGQRGGYPPPHMRRQTQTRQQQRSKQPVDRSKVIKQYNW